MHSRPCFCRLGMVWYGMVWYGMVWYWSHCRNKNSFQRLKWLYDKTGCLEILRHVYRFAVDGVSSSSWFLCSESEVSKILVNSPNKQSDTDPIPSWLLKECVSVIIATVTNIVNPSFRTRIFIFSHFVFHRVWYTFNMAASFMHSSVASLLLMNRWNLGQVLDILWWHWGNDMLSALLGWCVQMQLETGWWT